MNSIVCSSTNTYCKDYQLEDDEVHESCCTYEIRRK
jgi:hypothetical protein